MRDPRAMDCKGVVHRSEDPKDYILFGFGNSTVSEDCELLQNVINDILIRLYELEKR